MFSVSRGKGSDCLPNRHDATLSFLSINASATMKWLRHGVLLGSAGASHTSSFCRLKGNARRGCVRYKSANLTQITDPRQSAESITRLCIGPINIDLRSSCWHSSYSHPHMRDARWVRERWIRAGCGIIGEGQRQLGTAGFVALDAARNAMETTRSLRTLCM